MVLSVEFIVLSILFLACAALVFHFTDLLILMFDFCKIKLYLHKTNSNWNNCRKRRDAPYPGTGSLVAEIYGGNRSRALSACKDPAFHIDRVHYERDPRIPVYTDPIHAPCWYKNKRLHKMKRYTLLLSDWLIYNNANF